MIESKEKKFYVKFLDINGKEYQVFRSKDKYEKPFVVGEKGSEFKIQMIVSDRIDRSKTYGSKLTIDGEEYKSIKTFRFSGRYFGFKRGYGEYRAFRFNNSKYEMSEDNSNAANHYRQVGRITITFFNTTEIKFRKKHLHSYEPFNAPMTNPSKKQCMNSIQVDEGREFNNGHAQRMKRRFAQYEDKYTNIIEDERDIDEIEINYIDYYGLIAKGYINSRSIDHLIYIPYRVKEDLNKSVFKQSILRIVEELNKDMGLIISLETLETKFRQITEHEIEEHLGNYKSLKEFISNELCELLEVQNDEMFKIKPDMYIGQLYQNDTYIIPTQKLLTGNEIEYLKKRQLNKTNSTNMQVEPQEFVDLTLDEDII